MSFTILTLAILAITAINIYFQIRWGYKHGMTRSLINIAVLVFCAFFAAVISLLIGSSSGNLTLYVINRLGYYDFLVNTVGNIALVLAIVVQMVIPLLLYIPIFFVSKIALNLIFKLISNRFVKVNNSKKTNYYSEDESFYVRKDRTVGAVLGVISGFIISVIIMMPFVGLLKSASGVAKVIKEATDIEYTEFGSSIEAVPKYANDIGVTVMDSCGAGLLYEIATTTTVAGHTTSINKEIDAVKDIDFKSAVDLFSDTTEVNADTLIELEPLLKDLSESFVFKVFAVEVIRGASLNWLDDHSYAGIKKPNFGEQKIIDDLFDNVLNVCSTTTIYTFDADVETIINLIKIIDEEEAVLNADNYNDLMSGLGERKILERIDDELSKNPHMTPIRTAVKELIMGLVAAQINTPNFTEAQKQDIYRDLAAVLNDSQGIPNSQRVDEISGTIMNKLDEKGIDVSESVVKELTQLLCDGVIGTDGNITDRDVQHFIESYMEQSDGE